MFVIAPVGLAVLCIRPHSHVDLGGVHLTYRVKACHDEQRRPPVGSLGSISDFMMIEPGMRLPREERALFQRTRRPNGVNKSDFRKILRRRKPPLYTTSIRSLRSIMRLTWVVGSASKSVECSASLRDTPQAKNAWELRTVVQMPQCGLPLA